MLEVRLTFGEVRRCRLQRDVVLLLRILQRGCGAGHRLLEGVARRALLIEAPLEFCFALRQPRDVGERRLMLAPDLIAGFVQLAQMRGKAGTLRFGLGALPLEMRLTVGALIGRCLQRNLEFCFALRQPRDVGDGQLMLAPNLIAGLLYLSQPRGEASVFRLRLNPLTLKVRLTFGELPGRGLQRAVVSLLRVL